MIIYKIINIVIINIIVINNIILSMNINIIIVSINIFISKSISFTSYIPVIHVNRLLTSQLYNGVLPLFGLSKQERH